MSHGSHAFWSLRQRQGKLHSNRRYHFPNKKLVCPKAVWLTHMMCYTLLAKLISSAFSFNSWLVVYKKWPCLMEPLAKLLIGGGGSSSSSKHAVCLIDLACWARSASPRNPRSISERWSSSSQKLTNGSWRKLLCRMQNYICPKAAIAQRSNQLFVFRILIVCTTWSWWCLCKRTSLRLAK